MTPPPTKKSKNFMINSLLDLQSGGGDFLKLLGEETKITRKFNLTKLSTKFLITGLPDQPEGLLRELFQKCIDQTLEISRDNQIDPDQLGCTVSSQLLESDIWIPIREITPNTVDSILNQFLKVAQSKKQDQGMLWGENFSVSVTCIDKKNLPTTRNINGRGGKSTRRISDKNLIKIHNSDNFCLFYALMASFVYSICSWSKSKFYDYMHGRFGMRHRLEQDTKNLMANVGAPLGQSTYDAKEWVPKVFLFLGNSMKSLFSNMGMKITIPLFYFITTIIILMG
ncbi:unnamed protein product [Meloidogyne enterolobii]|uniref:Uncharacterized protein n=1 Tax=Meloidogyne enterolobii TaxID=390850 RepID=A0ACB0YUC8_MELEN